MTRRFRFLETTVYIDFYLKVHVHDTERGSQTTVQPVRIPALVAWLMVQGWRWLRQWTVVRAIGQGVKGQSIEWFKWAVALPAVVLLGVARWNDNAILL